MYFTCINKAIKSQALVDFIVDWTEMEEMTRKPDSLYWKMYFDGSKLIDGSGARVVLVSPKGDKLHYVLKIHFAATNNIAEYEALLHGLRMAKEMGIDQIECYGDSDLIVQQCTGTWDAEDPIMAEYRRTVHKIGAHFAGFEFKHINRHCH